MPTRNQSKSRRTAKFPRAAWQNLRKTLGFLHRPIKLPEFPPGELSLEGLSRHLTENLLGQALAQNALPEEVVAVQLVTRRIDRRAVHDFPLLVRGENHLTVAKRRQLVAAFAYMTHGLANREISIHRRIRDPGRTGNTLSAGTFVAYPKAGLSERTIQPLDAGMHQILLEFENPHPRYPAKKLDPFFLSAREMPETDIPGVIRYAFPGDLSKAADELLNEIASMAPSWNPSTVADSEPGSGDGRLLQELAERIAGENAYRALVAPLHACGPIIVCAPKVYDARQLSRPHDNWVFDAGLTVMLRPGTKLLSDPVLCSRIMIVAEEVATQVAALSGLLPQAFDSSRGSIVREIFGLISHSLGGTIAAIQSTDPTVRQFLNIERITLLAASELEGEPTGNYTWPRMGFEESDLVSSARMLIVRNAERRLEPPEMFALTDRLPPDLRVSARFGALACELCRNLGKHHKSQGQHTGDVVLEMVGSKLRITSRSMAERGDARDLADQSRWFGGGGDIRTPIKGLRLVYALARSLTDGGEPAITITVPAEFLPANAPMAKLRIVPGAPAVLVGHVRSGWCTIQIDNLQPS